MLIFDRDGNEETMCGNGIRCLARYFFDRYTNKNEANILTKDGIKQARDFGNIIEINIGKAKQFMNMGDKYFVYIGCPHIVIIDNDIKWNFQDVPAMEKIGKRLCHDTSLCCNLGIKPTEGVYINFVQSHGTNYRILTYERHVERCTFACGTGSTAAAYVLHKIFRVKFPIV